MKLCTLGFVFIVLFTLNSLAETRSVACSGNIHTNLQNAVNLSVDGDIVRIGAGTCSSSSNIKFTNKNITIQGQGIDVTRINFPGGGFRATITDVNKAKFRISSMTMFGTGATSPLFSVDSQNAPSASSGWRIDHIKMDYSAKVNGDAVYIIGATYGLFDHNDLRLTQNTWIIALFTQTSLGESCGWDNPPIYRSSGWYNLSLPSQYNTANAIFFEDNVFRGNEYSAFFDSSCGGSRVVFRHNLFISGFLYNHWVRGNDLDVFQWEVYNNKFVGTSSWGQGGGEIPVRFESGTGVFYDNTLTGFAEGNRKFLVDDRRAGGSQSAGDFGACDGSMAVDGNAGDPAAPGWPCIAQIGRGFGRTYQQIISGNKLPSLPAYSWNNGIQESCHKPSAGGAACVDSAHITVTGVPGDIRSQNAYIKSTPHPNGEVDFVNSGKTPMPGYTAYVYPHPLASGVTPPPPVPGIPLAPRNVQVK